MERNKVSVNITEDLVLFFDMDGTLIDTNLANFNSYKMAINAVTKSGSSLTFDPTKRFNRGALKRTIPNLTEAEYEKIIQEKERCYPIFLHETVLIPENARILLKYSKTNRTILVTNCRKDRVYSSLGFHKLTDKFSAIFCRELCSSNQRVNKFQNAISALRITPDKIVAFENEESEINDAIEAGIKVINPKVSVQ